MKKFLSLLSSLAITTPLISGVVACGDGDDIVIGFSRGNDGEYQAFKKMIDTFKEENPDLKIKERQFTDYTKEITAMIAAGNLPDVVLVPPINLNQLLSAGALKPLDFIDSTKFNYSLLEPYTAKVNDSSVELIKSGELLDNDASEEDKFIVENNGQSVIVEPSISQEEIANLGYSVYAFPKDASTLATYVNVDSSKGNGNNTKPFIEENEEFSFEQLFQAAADDDGFTIGENPLVSRDLGMLSLVGDTKNDSLLDAMIENKDYAATLWGNKYRYINKSAFNKTAGAENFGVYNQANIESGQWTGSLFASYKADVVLEGNWAIANTELSREAKTFDIRSLPKAQKFEYSEIAMDNIQAVGELEQVSMIYTNGWGLSRNAKEGSEKLLEYIVGAEGNEIWTSGTKMISGNIDVLKKQEEMYQEDERLLTFLDESSAATPEQVGKIYPALIAAWEAWAPSFYTSAENNKTFDDFYNSLVQMIQDVKQNSGV